MAPLLALHALVVRSQLLAPLLVVRVLLAAPPALQAQPVQLVTLALDGARELATSVLLISSRLEARLPVLHALVVLSQLLVPLLAVPVLLVVPLALQARLVQLVTLALD